MPAKKEKTYEQALEQMNIYIQEHNMRHTPVRQMVLEQACLLPQPFTASQLEKACLAERISAGTVYNSLSLFISEQILHAIKRQHGQTATQYEFTGGKSIRMQIICRKCGRVSEFRDKAIEHLVMTRPYSNFNVQRLTMYAYGECKHCRRPQLEDTENQ